VKGQKGLFEWCAGQATGLTGTLVKKACLTGHLGDQLNRTTCLTSTKWSRRVDQKLHAPQKINFHLYTSDVAEYKCASVLCDVTCVQAKIDFSW
jgi:hypothetical protein